MIRHIILLPTLSLFCLISGLAQPGYYPPPSSVNFHNDTLTIYPPDSLPGDPVLLLGYNIYIDDVFFDNILVNNPGDPVDYILGYPEVLPGTYEFCGKTVYNDWISESACDTGMVLYGFDLPFYEDWESGGFDENLWIAGGNWVVNTDEGNSAPAAEFTGNPALSDYSFSLESYPMIAIGQTLGRIYLDFNIKLAAVNASGEEEILFQVWNWISGTWTPVEAYSNEDGSFDWSSAHININSLSRNKIFRIRFLARGVNSANIIGWYIDNIQIYRKCDSPTDLRIYEFEDHNELEWVGPDGCNPSWWLHWDDYVNWTSIGTGEAVEFDVAARWTPDQLAPYTGSPITQIAFFPAEAAANYRARIWIGDGADTLILDDPVPSPLIDEWNYYTLPNPITLDVTKELWVGYNVVTPTGYPAGVDYGPAIDGYGNMMYFEGTWQTLLDLNPGLDCNWNIACRLGPFDDDPQGYYKIFRQINNDEFQVIDSTMNWYYEDNDINLPDYYCYKVTLQWYTNNGDSCESMASNIVCESININVEENEPEKTITIYPNPAYDLLNIQSDDPIREVLFFNTLGEMVMKLEIGNSEAQVNVSRLVNGFYFVKVVTDKETFKNKILIIR